MQDTGIRSERDNHRSGIYKTIFLWWVHSDAASIFYCSSIHWAACMGVLPAVIASINSDPPAKEQTQYHTHFWWTEFPYSWEVAECFLISSWNLEIRESLQRYTTPTFTLHKRKCHETFETEKKHAWKDKEWDEHCICGYLPLCKGDAARVPVSLSPFLFLIFGKHQFVSVKLAPKLRYSTPVLPCMHQIQGRHQAINEVWTAWWQTSCII